MILDGFTVEIYHDARSHERQINCISEMMKGIPSVEEGSNDNDIGALF